MKIYNVLGLMSKSICRSGTLQFIFKRNNFQCIDVLKKYQTNTSKKLSVVATNTTKHSRKIHEFIGDDEFDDLSLVAELDLENRSSELGYAKNLLYNDVDDPLIYNLKNSVSVQDVLSICKQNKNIFSYKHAALSVLVLSDLRKIYEQVTGATSEEDFINQLKGKTEFLQVLQLLENNLEALNRVESIYVLRHLTALGLNICDPLSQSLIKKVKSNLITDFCLSEAASFFATIFKDASLRPFLIVQELVPFVLERIETCPIEDFEDLTICLNKIQRIITIESVTKYRDQVVNYISNGELSTERKKTILSIISFLGLPAWRDSSTNVIAKCMLVLKGNLNTLNAKELTLFYDIFFQTKESGDLLNEIQRCALTYLYKPDEDITHYTDIQLKLFLSLLCFLSPLQRTQYQKISRRYVYYSPDYNRDSLLTLAKVLSYTRTSDNNLCEILWRNMTNQIKQPENDFAIFKLSQNYINFHADLNNYSYAPFERTCMSQFKKQFHNTYIRYIPARLCNILSFALIYSKDKEFLETLLTKLEENWEQVNSLQCLTLAHSIKIVTASPNKYVSRFQLHRLRKVLDKAMQKEFMLSKHSAKKTGWLLKSCVLTNANQDLTIRLIDCINNMQVASSRSVENITYCLLQTNILHKEVLNQCIKYLIDNKQHILGYDAERVLYLCYHFGYQSENIDEFIDVVINSIIRDQERLTGLTLLQTALALSFYNKLPQSVIKQIFNVEFLDKLDGELANCYSKDKYPQRVRNKLMQLNRAVCLLYPESNVPWFHQKFIEVAKNQVVQKLERQRIFPSRVKAYLSQVLEKPEHINEHVITPYGYHVDFELNFNHESKIVAPGSTEIRRKLAVLLVQPVAFTNLHVQLKGRYQMMKKHLEILGYEVIFISFTEWMSLVYAGERIEYLSNLLWPNKANTLELVNDR